MNPFDTLVGVLNMVSWKYHDAVLEKSCSPSRGNSCTQFYCNSVVRAPVMISNEATMFSTTWYVYLSWKLASAGTSKVLGGGWNLQSHETSYLITIPSPPGWRSIPLGTPSAWGHWPLASTGIHWHPLASTGIHWHPLASTGSKFGSIRIYPHPQHHYVFMSSFRPLRLGLLFVHWLSHVFTVSAAASGSAESSSRQVVSVVSSFWTILRSLMGGLHKPRETLKIT